MASVYYIIDNGYDIHMTAINNFHLVILSLDNAVDVVLDPSIDMVVNVNTSVIAGHIQSIAYNTWIEYGIYYIVYCILYIM